MKIKRILRTILVLIVLGSNVGCDQISKTVARQNLAYDEQVNVLSSYVILVKVENTGAFLSLGTALPEFLRIFLLAVLPTVALALGIVYVLTQKSLSNLSVIGGCFIIGGGIGNIADRILYGSVTDFLHIDLGVVRTGIFNMADVSIFVGLFVLMLDLVAKRKQSGAV